MNFSGPKLDPIAAAETSSISLAQRGAMLAQSIRRSFAPIVRSAVGTSPRPVTLSRRLEIDRTLAARIIRSVRADQDLLVLQEIPAPNGLRIFVEAARNAGIPESLLRDAETTILAFEAIIDEFPGGRSAFTAAIGDVAPEVRDRTERAAKQAVFKSMSNLLGYHAEATISTVIIQPSEDGQMCDSAHVMVKRDLRRIRATVPITAFGRTLHGDGGERGPVLWNFEGDRRPRPDEPCLLSEFCSEPIPQLDVLQQREVFLYTLGENQPPVNMPVTLTSGFLVRDGFPRYASATDRYGWESVVPRIPSKVLITDMLLRDDCYPDSQPFATPRLYGLAKFPNQPDEKSFQLDQLDLSTPMEHLGVGRYDLRIREMLQYPGLIASAFDRLGWDPTRFRAYRCRIQYPVPMVSVTQWIKLEER